MKNALRSKGFTLIELLVVIAIIALLLSVILPSLKKAKLTTQDVLCRSNLKQWGVIWKVYAEESNGLLPALDMSGAARGDWITELRDDYPTDKITVCPRATKYVDYTALEGDPANNHGGVFSAYRNIIIDASGQEREEHCSYGMNCFAYSTSSSIFGGESLHWKKFEINGVSTNTIPLFMDSAFRGGFPRYSATYDGITMPNQKFEDNGFDRVYDGLRQFALPRHGSGGKAGSNVLFFDLSARHVMVKEMWSLKWHREFDTGLWPSQRGTIWPGTWMGTFSEDF
jgi:prepilin-type N-terminal cleavage/methylation domain-containing protein